MPLSEHEDKPAKSPLRASVQVHRNMFKYLNIFNMLTYVKYVLSITFFKKVYILVHVNPPLLSHFSFFPTVFQAPFQAHWATPTVHSQYLLSSPPFLPPQMLLQPFTLLPFPCCLLSLTTALPLASAASHAHVLTCFCPTTKPQHLWAQVVLTEDFPDGKP